MNSFSKIAIGAAAVIGIALAAAAYAHGPGFGYGQGMGMMGQYGGGAGAGMHGMHGMFRGAGAPGPCSGSETIDARLGSIESELKLTAEQTPAWEAFETVVRTQMQTMTEAHPHWSQDDNEHIAFMEQRLAGMKAVQKARTELYKVLTPEQKATADRYGIRGPRV